MHFSAHSNTPVVLTKSEHSRENLLLRQLSSVQHDDLLARAERIEFGSGTVLTDAEHTIEHVYFPTTAVLSVLSVMADRTAVETAVVGHEGMSPIAAFHGVDMMAEQTVVQVPGEVLRFPVEDFRGAVIELPALNAALHRFSVALFTFAAQTSGCNRKHSVVHRCARWLMVTHDRVPGDEFELTHLFLSQMLGVRRSSVTLAAEELRKVGAIEYTRGRIVIRDRAKLRKHACECYDIVRSTYKRLIEGRDEPSPLTAMRLKDESDQTLLNAGHPEGHRESPAQGVRLGSVERA